MKRRRPKKCVQIIYAFEAWTCLFIFMKKEENKKLLKFNNNEKKNVGVIVINMWYNRNMNIPKLIYAAFYPLYSLFSLFSLSLHSSQLVRLKFRMLSCKIQNNSCCKVTLYKQTWIKYARLSGCDACCKGIARALPAQQCVSFELNCFCLPLYQAILQFNCRTFCCSRIFLMIVQQYYLLFRKISF